LGLLGYTLIVLAASTFLPYRLIGFARASFPDFEKVCSDILAPIPTGRTVYIPPTFWSAALRDSRNEIKFATLVVASPKEMRQRYEKMLYAGLKPGDFLILDRLAGSNFDANTTLINSCPTFQYLPIDPQFWKLVRTEKASFPSATSNFGYHFEIYEFLGGDWAATLLAPD
jgi:hypothetical protein